MIQQVGALPYRTNGGSAEILLITSRQTGRWIVPKGHLIRGKAPHEAAAIEAEEEAGVRGLVSPIALGRYDYVKRVVGLVDQPARVEVFALEVREELAGWKERHQRERRWFGAHDAAVAVDEADLGELIHRFATGQGPRPAT